MKTKNLALEGEKIYEFKLKKKLEPQYKGQYVAIEIVSEDYYIGRDMLDAIEKAKKKYPKRKFYILRIGRMPSVKFYTPINLL